MASILKILEDEATPLTLLELPAKKPQPFANRRSLPRLTARFAVIAEDGTRYEGVDLSFGGLMCLGQDPMWPGNLLRFGMVLPDGGGQMSVTGRVVELVSFRGKVGMRIRFESIDDAGRKRIATWMARVAGV